VLLKVPFCVCFIKQVSSVFLSVWVVSVWLCVYVRLYFCVRIFVRACVFAPMRVSFLVLVYFVA